MPLFGIFAQVPKAVVSAVAPATWPASRGALGVRPSSPNAALKQAFQHPMRHKIYCLATILFFFYSVLAKMVKFVMLLSVIPY